MITELPERGLGDMSAEEFRAYGHQVIEMIAAYLQNSSSYPVLSRAVPGEITGSIPAHPPVEGESFDTVLDDFKRTLLSGITHWNHPGFFAYFGITGSGPGILADALASALNVNAMLWRTSPAATELELLAVDWVRQLLGLPADFQGHIQDTASTSTLVAIAAAREAIGLDIRNNGLAGRELPPLRLYCSEEAHSSVEKSAITLGLGRAGLRKIATDDDFRMVPDALEAAIQGDIENGDQPVAIVATVGTTSTTSIDPIGRIADLAERFSLWLHVDAAYGGAAAAIPEMRHLHAGWERADSIVINPHKWLFVPIDCSTLFLRDPEIARRAFSLVPDYLTTPEDDSVANLMDYGPALGRRFRGLKLWMTLRYFGAEGIAARLHEHVRLARRFAEWIDAEDDWQRMAPVPFSTVCFRYVPPDSASADDQDAINEAILQRVNASGEVFISHTRLHGRYTLRVAIGNIRTQEEHLRRAWDLLREAANSG